MTAGLTRSINSVLYRGRNSVHHKTLLHWVSLLICSSWEKEKPQRLHLWPWKKKEGEIKARNEAICIEAYGGWVTWVSRRGDRDTSGANERNWYRRVRTRKRRLWTQVIKCGWGASSEEKLTAGLWGLTTTCVFAVIFVPPLCLSVSIRRDLTGATWEHLACMPGRGPWQISWLRAVTGSVCGTSSVLLGHAAGQSRPKRSATQRGRVSLAGLRDAQMSQRGKVLMASRPHGATATAVRRSTLPLAVVTWATL